MIKNILIVAGVIALLIGGYYAYNRYVKKKSAGSDTATNTGGIQNPGTGTFNGDSGAQATGDVKGDGLPAQTGGNYTPPSSGGSTYAPNGGMGTH